jgi:hypothetical protein
MVHLTDAAVLADIGLILAAHACGIQSLLAASAPP